MTTPAELRAAVAAANPGDEIVLAPGDYLFTSRVNCDRPGAPGAPITVRAGFPGCARLFLDTVEGFYVAAPWWTFAGLDIQGVCANHSDCEHAFHVVGDAEHFTLLGSRLHEFNAMIKGNGIDPGTGRVFPDDVLIEGNEFWNDAPRQTSNPVTPIDVVGGRRWTIRRNFIHDHEKAQGDTISYAAFLKGNSRDGLFEGNVVACEWLHAGGIRLGLSFGGGGSAPPSICEDGVCPPEHQNGVMRANLIVNCPADVGIYLNSARNCGVHHNTLYDSAGIDVRFPDSIVDLRCNLLTGRIRTRDGGTMTTGSNLEQTGNAAFESWFRDPARFDFTPVGDGSSFVDRGEMVPSAPDDFCGGPRDATPDIGAVEYDADACDTTRELPLLVPPPPGPPAGPGGTLRLAKSADLRDVLLSWGAGPDAYWNLYRDDVAFPPGASLLTPFLPVPSCPDTSALLDGTTHFYVVRAVAPCTGEEAD